MDITPAGVRAWRHWLLSAGIGGPTVAGSYRFLRAVLNTAVDDELIRKNPCRIKGADKDNSPERPTVTIGEVYAIADAIKPWWRALVLMAAFSSLCWGELVALRRRHVDLEHGLVTVKAKLAEVGGRFEVGLPKSQAGVRVVAIPQAIVADLTTHLDKWSEAGANGRVFVGPGERRHGGPTSTSTGRRRSPSRACRSTPTSGCTCTTCATSGTTCDRRAPASVT